LRFVIGKLRDEEDFISAKDALKNLKEYQ
jgi:hypothetical protein